MYKEVKFYGKQVEFEWLKIKYDDNGKPYRPIRIGIFYGLSKDKKHFRIRPLNAYIGYNTKIVKIPTNLIKILDTRIKWLTLV